MATISLILLLVLTVPLLVGVAAVMLRGRQPKALAATALLFHSTKKQSWIAYSYVRKDTFAEFLSTLSGERCRTATVAEYAGGATSWTENPQEIVLLTFDDGFEDFYRIALPLLRRYSMKATFFPIVDLIGCKTEKDVFRPQQHATKEQIREIASLGHEIGSHTLSHPDLTLLQDNALDRELILSKRILEDIAGREVTSISFPYGSWNDRVWDHAREAGYRAATVYRHGGKLPPALIPVIGVYSFDTADDVCAKRICSGRFSISLARSRIMPHFARGTALWKFRSNYTLLGRGKC